MKKLIIALALGIGFSGFSQDWNRGDNQNSTPEQRVQKQVEKMTKDLSLDPKQQEAVSALLKEKSAKAQEAKTKREAQRASGEKMTNEQRNALRTAMLAEREDTDTKLKAILTADQFKKYTVSRQENEDRMRQRMRERRDGGNDNEGGFGGNDNGGNGNRGNNDGGL